MGAKHAKWFVTSAKTTGWLRETELVPKTQGVAKSLKEVKFAMGLAASTARCRRRSRRTSRSTSTRRGRSTTSSSTQGREGADGIVQTEKALGRGSSTPTTGTARRPSAGRTAPGSFAKPLPARERRTTE